jgi:glycosyltransferase involved in cell wall biosynthesis
VRNNFALPSETTSDVADTERTAADLWASLDLPEGAFTLLFAGNIGRFQGLEDAVQALAQTRPGSDVHLVLMGDGTAVQSLRDLAENVGVAERVHFLGLQSVSVAREVMRLADAGLVSLQPDVIRFAYPSKTATYAEQGMVLVVVVEPDSVLAREVRESGAGIVVAPGDVEGLATEMSRLAEKSEGELQHMSTSAQALAHRDFEEAAALQWWSDLVRESR